jgi:hypothetical protein
MSRSINKIKVDHATPELYKAYIKKLIDKDSAYNIKKPLFTKVLKELNTGVINLMIKSNFVFKIPYRLGELSITKNKVKYRLDEDGKLITKYLPCDYKATRALWDTDSEAKENRILVYHTNEHTEGYKLNFYWKKQKSYVKGMSIMQFIACRWAKREIPKQISLHPELNFFERPNTKRTYKFKNK